MGTQLKIWKIFFIAMQTTGTILTIQPSFLFHPAEHNLDTSEHPVSQADSKYFIGVVTALVGAIASSVHLVLMGGALSNIDNLFLNLIVGLVGIPWCIIASLVDSSDQVICFLV